MCIYIHIYFFFVRISQIQARDMYLRLGETKVDPFSTAMVLAFARSQKIKSNPAIFVNTSKRLLSSFKQKTGYPYRSNSTNLLQLKPCISQPVMR